MTKPSPYILIVDDDPEDAEMLAEQVRLRFSGLEVVCFYDGMEALDYLGRQEAGAIPVAIIADYAMPCINGAQLLQSLRPDRRYDHVVKLVWSSSQNRAYMEECLGAGAREFFIKPSDLPSLMEIVNSLSIYMPANQGRNVGVAGE